MRNFLAALFNGDPSGRRFAMGGLAANDSSVSLVTQIQTQLRFLFRYLRLIVHVAVGLTAATIINLDFTHRIDADDIARRWLRRLMRILSVRFRVQGEPVAGGQMIVCNHVSWLDIPLVGAALCSRFVAKSEIQHWPVAGWLAKCIGTFYIRRGAGGSKPLLDKLNPFLQRGGSVVIFPEGTTTDGRQVLSFHARLFQAAVDAGCAVQPVALRYWPTVDGQQIAPFIGDDDLVSHILRLLRSPGLDAELIYCAPIQPAQHEDRQQLALRAEESIRKAIAPRMLAKTPALIEQQRRSAKAA